MAKFKEAGITVIPVVASVALAKRMEKEGADAVVVEGMEAVDISVSPQPWLFTTSSRCSEYTSNWCWWYW